MTTYRAWANGGTTDIEFSDLKQAEQLLRNLGYMASKIDSCDGSTKYWVCVDTPPSQWLDEIKDGAYPPASITAIVEE